jgi:hypothetical protein
MAFIARQTDFHAAIAPYRPAVAAPAQPHQSFWRRLFDAVMDGRQRRVQREVDQFVARHGRNMTDALERELNTRLFDNRWNIHR